MNLIVKCCAFFCFEIEVLYSQQNQAKFMIIMRGHMEIFQFEEQKMINFFLKKKYFRQKSNFPNNKTIHYNKFQYIFFSFSTNLIVVFFFSKLSRKHFRLKKCVVNIFYILGVFRILKFKIHLLPMFSIDWTIEFDFRQIWFLKIGLLKFQCDLEKIFYSLWFSILNEFLSLDVLETRNWQSIWNECKQNFSFKNA